MVIISTITPIRVPFRVLISLLITYLLSPAALQVGLQSPGLVAAGVSRLQGGRVPGCSRSGLLLSLRLPCLQNAGGLIIRIGFWGILYYNKKRNPPNPIPIIKVPTLVYTWPY